MLQTLKIHNFAIIEELEVEFNPHLNVFTGETGAGKSIILSALNLLCGGKFELSSARNPQMPVFVEAYFYFSEKDPILEQLSPYNIKCDQLCGLRLSRELTPAGKSICKCNQQAISLSNLKNIAPLLVNIHSQHQTYQLLSAARHFEFFCESADDNFQSLLQDYQKAYLAYRQLLQKQTSAEQRKSEITAAKKRLGEELELIAQVEPKISEEAELDKRLRFLACLADLSRHVQNISSLLNPDDEFSLHHLFIKMRRELDGLQRLDQKAGKMLQLFNESQLILDEMKGELGLYDSRLDNANPTEIHDIETRLADLERLKRRFGLTIPELLAYEKQAAEQLFALIHEEQNLENMDELVLQSGNLLVQQALELTEAKTSIKKLLEKEVNRVLKQLNMANASFEVVFYQKENFLTVGRQQLPLGHEGAENLEFYLRSNKGQEAQPLAKVASGGEVSRLMLALKKVFSGVQKSQTLIFDEIDTGIGGDTAHCLAEVLQEIATVRQAVVITHLAQIALVADAHYLIEKTSDQEKTSSSIKALLPAEKEAEIIRMLGLEKNNPQAKELIKKIFPQKTKNQPTKR